MYPALPVRSIEGVKQGVKKNGYMCFLLSSLSKQINDRLLDHTYIHTYINPSIYLPDIYLSIIYLSIHHL